MLEFTELDIHQLAGLSRCNARQSPPTQAETDELAADILARGVAEPLTLRHEDGEIRVLDGGRRYFALRRLLETHADAAAAIRFPVAFFDGDDAAALERSLVTFLHRADLHPVEEFERFVELRDRHRLSDEEIAARTHKPLRFVKARLRLGRLAPEVRDAWRAGTLTGEQAGAFAATDNPDAQRALLDKGHIAHWSAWQIARELRDKAAVALGDARAVFVGLDAYLAAGGRVDEQIFEEESYLLDGPILEKLARDKLDAAAREIAEREGWGWAATEFDSKPGDFVKAQRYDFLEEEGARLKEIEALLEEEEDAARQRALEEEYDEIEARGLLRAMPEAERAHLGVRVGIDPDTGALYVMRAVKQTPRNQEADRTAAAKPRAAKEDDADDANEGADAQKPARDDAPTGSQRSAVDEAARAGLAAACARAPRLALIFAVAQIGCGVPYRDGGVLDFDPIATRLDEPRCELLREIDAMTFTEALRHVAKRDHDDPALVPIAFAELVSDAINPTGAHNFDAVRVMIGVAAGHCDLSQDMRAAFDYPAYFGAAAKETALDVIRGLDGEAAASQAKKLKRPELAKAAATLARDRQWLPKILIDAPRIAAPDADETLERPIDERSAAQAMADAISEDEAARAENPSIDAALSALIEEAAVRAAAPMAPRFIRACVHFGDDGRIKSKELYDAYVEFTQARGGRPLSVSAFGNFIADLGVEKTRMSEGVHYLNIALREDRATADGGADV